MRIFFGWLAATLVFALCIRIGAGGAGFFFAIAIIIVTHAYREEKKIQGERRFDRVPRPTSALPNDPWADKLAITRNAHPGTLPPRPQPDPADVVFSEMARDTDDFIADLQRRINADIIRLTKAQGHDFTVHYDENSVGTVIRNWKGEVVRTVDE